VLRNLRRYYQYENPNSARVQFRINPTWTKADDSKPDQTTQETKLLLIIQIKHEIFLQKIDQNQEKQQKKMSSSPMKSRRIKRIFSGKSKNKNYLFWGERERERDISEREREI
jgi:hypothetical protein